MTEEAVRKALTDADYNVSHAASALGISRQRFYRLMSKYGISIKRVAA